MTDVVTTKPLFGLFDFAKASFERITGELATYGLEASPQLELRQRPGLLCSYDLTDGQIYLSFPEPSDPLGKLQLVVLRSLLQAESDAELDLLIRLLIPRLVAHELGHHLRDYRGLFSADRWHEEQVANLLACAATEHHLSPAERATLIRLLKRTLEVLAPRVESRDIAADSYYSPIQAFGATGVLRAGTVRSLELMNRLFSLPPEQLLRESGGLSAEFCDRLDDRPQLIAEFNEDYTVSMARYTYLHLGWALIDLESREHRYVDEVAREHFQQRVPLLPVVARTEEPQAAHVRACFRAHQELAPLSRTASRYFYRRYRTLLMEVIASQPAVDGVSPLTGEAQRLLESWDDDEGSMLRLARPLAPPALQALFPTALGEALSGSEIALAFPSETDARLRQYLLAGADDPAAAGTLARLEVLEQADIYRGLPAEVLLELTQTLCRLKIPAGETILWEGSANDDVFILLSGRLEVYTARDGAEKRLAAVQPGEVFGEMAFFTGEPRTASVRATVASECLVLSSASLHLLAFRYPVVLMGMAKALALRLRQMSAA